MKSARGVGTLAFTAAPGATRSRARYAASG